MRKHSNHAEILQVFSDHGPMTDYELVEHHFKTQVPQSVRRRRRELFAAGDLQRFGFGESPTGKPAQRFALRCM